MQQFTQLDIPFSQSDHISVFYAHLQNLMMKYNLLSCQKIQHKQIMSQINRVLFDIYKQYYKNIQQYNVSFNSLKNIANQSAQLINSCKTDRQTIVEITEDRQKLMEKLRQATDNSLVFIQQNENLHLTINKMQELNNLLIEKISTLQQQIKCQSINVQSMEYVKLLKQQYNKIEINNENVQKDVQQIATKAALIEPVFVTVQIFSAALKSAPQLKKLICQQAIKSGQVSNIKQEQFMKIDYIQLFATLKS